MCTEGEWAPRLGGKLVEGLLPSQIYHTTGQNGKVFMLQPPPACAHTPLCVPPDQYPTHATPRRDSLLSDLASGPTCSPQAALTFDMARHVQMDVACSQRSTVHHHTIRPLHRHLAPTAALQSTPDSCRFPPAVGRSNFLAPCTGNGATRRSSVAAAAPGASSSTAGKSPQDLPAVPIPESQDAAVSVCCAGCLCRRKAPHAHGTACTWPCHACKPCHAGTCHSVTKQLKDVRRTHSIAMSSLGCKKVVGLVHRAITYLLCMCCRLLSLSQLSRCS